MRQISRTGMKIVAPAPAEVGRSIALRLAHGADAIDVRGTIRWCRSVASDDPPAGETAGRDYEIGIAFTEVGEAGPSSLWRSLTVYSPDPTGE